MKSVHDTALPKPIAHGGRPAELNLLLACTQWPHRPEDGDLIRHIAAQPLDWHRFTTLVEHHRLVPLVSRNLHASLSASVEIPPAPGQQLALDRLTQLSAANAYRALRSLAELRRIAQQFHARGISLRVLKGIALAQSVFGDLSLRAAGDIDLLIEESSILAADEVLQEFGYCGLFRLDLFSPRRLAFYRAHWKDLAYEGREAGYEVDLHWRCFRNSAMAGAGLCAVPARETVSFGGFEVDTLPPTETLLYLCVHGTLDGWLYLKSLADVAAQVRGMTPAELDGVARVALQYSVLPELTAALILVRSYFAIDSWSQYLLPASERTVAHILRFAHLNLEGGGFLADRSAVPTTTTFAFEAGLRRSVAYRRELLVRILFRARMWETIPLPDFLFFLYPLLSPIEWIIHRVRQWLGKPSAIASTLSV